MPDNYHRGIADLDHRNQSVIEHFRPAEMTEHHVRVRLTRANARRTPAQIEAQVAKFFRELASKPHRPSPPLSQPVDQVANPLTGLSTHPDLVTQLWRLDDALPASCRWALWGYPALVHPQTGVIFAVGFGTIGIVLRLPPGQRADATAVRGTNPGRDYDISPAGSEWAFLPLKSGDVYCVAAYEYAGGP